tara:strand:+ start:1204 stop:1410 length:207 start_codon:yes stop_codon:yes gene_type:complete
MPKKSKSEIMNLLCKNFTSYASTQWLKNPNKNAGGLVPSECMSKDKHITRVYNALSREIEQTKEKKCK